MVNGQWSMINDQWSMVNVQWSMVNGQWSMVNGQWSMINVLRFPNAPPFPISGIRVRIPPASWSICTAASATSAAGTYTKRSTP